MKLYHELAEYYYSIEKENRNIDDDIHMILTLLDKKNRPSLLDLGCGSGEHLDRLSKSGIDCTGIDSSHEMLKIAKSRFPGSAEFIEEDIKTFDFSNKFDIVISLFGSFDYLIEDHDINSALRSTWKALKPNGIGVFEIWNAIPIQKVKGKKISLVSKINYNDKIIKRERGFELLDYPDKTIVEVNYNYIISENEIIHDKHIMRAFTDTEFENYLKNNGFQIVAFFANSSMEVYNDKSGRIIVHFKK